MYETWLRPNRRAIWFGCLPPLLAIVLGLWMALRSSDQNAVLWRWLGAALIATGIGIIVMLLRQLNRPRIAYQNGQVLFYLRSGAPIAVPAKVVEAFFLGQGPVVLPAHIQNKHNTVNLVARLSPREAEWAQREVKPFLGHWCDGYVTVRGTWSEPLDGNVIRRLNKRLKEVHTTGEPSA
jgi:hypothetical protein